MAYCCVILKTPFPHGCSRFLSSVDRHDGCLQCLGIQQAEAAFVNGLCIYWWHVTMAALRLRLSPHGYVRSSLLHYSRWFLCHVSPFSSGSCSSASPIPTTMMMGRLGGMLTFPRWGERLRCTCTRKMLPLG